MLQIRRLFGTIITLILLLIVTIVQIGSLRKLNGLNILEDNYSTFKENIPEGAILDFTKIPKNTTPMFDAYNHGNFMLAFA